MLKDLGLFAAFSLIGASLCSLIFCHIHCRRERKSGSCRQEFSWIDRIASPSARIQQVPGDDHLRTNDRFRFLGRKRGFESDLAAMNFMSGELKASERNGMTHQPVRHAHPVYVVTDGKTRMKPTNNEKSWRESVRCG